VVDSLYPQLALESMHRCLSLVNFARAVLVTGPLWRPTEPTTVEVEYAKGIDSVKAYSMYLLGKAVDHVYTEHALIVQWDSFILSADAWDESFLDYDYIGAPWPLRPQNPVGNGGFSLRSRRLMGLIANGEFAHTHPEDLCICEQHRETLTNHHGVRFAPKGLARRFSFEYGTHDSTCFGFHGLFSFPLVLSEGDLQAWLGRAPEDVLRSKSARALAKSCIRGGHWAALSYILKARMRGSIGMRLDALKLHLRATLRRVLFRLLNAETKRTDDF
jgi:hypothetical protein